MAAAGEEDEEDEDEKEEEDDKEDAVALSETREATADGWLASSLL